MIEDCEACDKCFLANIKTGLLRLFMFFWNNILKGQLINRKQEGKVKYCKDILVEYKLPLGKKKKKKEKHKTEKREGKKKKERITPKVWEENTSKYSAIQERKERNMSWDEWKWLIESKREKYGDVQNKMKGERRGDSKCN